MLEPESFQLRRTIPPKIDKLLREREIAPDDVIIATDTDLSIAGEYSERWIIVTQKHVMVFIIEEDTALLVREVPITRIEKARTDSRVGSGFLEAKTDEDVYEELLRFSNRNADKFAKVAATIKSLAGGRPVDLTVEEQEKVQIGRCQKCGVRLADRSMSICHKCLKRGFVFMRFLARTKDYWPLTSMAMILVVLSIFLSLFPQQLVKILIDNVFSKDDDVPFWFGALVKVFNLGSDHYKWLYIIVGALALTTLLAVIIIWLRERIAVTIANRLAFELRRDVFEKLENQEVEYHDDHPVGQLMTRCTQDVEALQGFINQLTSGFGYQILSLIGVAGIMFYMNWQLALIACLPAPLVMVCTVIFYKWVVPQWHKYWSTRSNLSNILHASLSGVRVVKAFAQEAREAARFEGYNAKFRDAGLSVGYASAWFYQMMGFVFQLGSYFIWLYGGHTILNIMNPDAVSVPSHGLTVGGLMAFLGYLGMFYAPLNSLTQMSNWFTQFTTQAHRVFEVLDREEMIKEPADAIALDIQGEIAFKNVTFGYDPHIPVLHEVSFNIKKGEMIGVVGHSGCGKSTTVSLIMRFYDPDEGSITIDNIDITRIKKKVLRRQIGMVAQDPFLFRGTIAENICYGNPDVSREVILDSSVAANAHMFITRNHDGYDTRLGERGSGLSGGERQRVAIARALLHNPRVLILDEATSSVDTIAEREIQKALEALSLGRTTIAIAHRLTTLRNCDRIMVFEEGVIREHGSHDDLMEQNGIYKKLVDIQTQLTSEQTTTIDNIKALDDLEKAEEAKAKSPVSTYKRNTEVPRIRYLDPKKLSIHSMDEGGMRVEFDGENSFHVRAYRCFPVSLPSEFIALWTGSSALEHQEIGMIRRLDELSPSTRLAVEHELAKRYFIHYISTIGSIKEDVGFLHWVVDTDKGPMEFMTKRWDRDTVVEGGVKGRIIFDVDNNRYEIENLDALDPQSAAIFHKYIYW